MDVLMICGSLRAASVNRKLLQAVEQRAPEYVNARWANIAELPHYNGDLDGDEKPASVAQLIQDMADADALLMAFPEYNYAIPGVLKNAIDWASRPAYQSVMANKPTGIMTAVPGLVGGARAQSDMKIVLSATLSPVFPHPEFLVPLANSVFDETGKVIDENVDRHLNRYVEEFISWVRRQEIGLRQC